MTNRIGDSFSTPPSLPQGDSVAELSGQLRAKLLDVAQNLQDILNQPGKLGSDSTLTEFQTHALQLSSLVTKAMQC